MPNPPFYWRTQPLRNGSLFPLRNGSSSLLIEGTFCYLLPPFSPHFIFLTMSPQSHLLLPPIQIHKTPSAAGSLSFALGTQLRNTISVSTERPPPEPPPYVKQIIHFGPPDLPSPSVLKLVLAPYPPSILSLVRPPRKPPDEFQTDLKVTLLQDLCYYRPQPKPPWLLLGGFGSYLFGMTPTIAKQIPEAGTANDVKSLGLGWMIAFLFVVSFLGLFSVVPLRKIMIVDFRLTYPSGTATAHLINSFHTSEGAKLAKKQVKALGKFFSFSFLWGFFQWFFTAGDACGFTNFPTFGLEAYQRKFYFDFSATYVGVGMICPYITNISLLIGGVLSWGVMWPLIGAKKGDWFPADLKESSLHGLQGYRVFIGIAMILGDGLFNFGKVLCITLKGLYKQLKKKDKVAQSEDPNAPLPPTLSFDDKRRTEMFLKDQIPSWFAIAGYVIIAIISIITIPHIFHQLKWYHIICIYIIAPALAFCNAYGCGLTDWSLASTYGKLAIFTIGAWTGANGGILASLAACGVMMNIVSTASDLMQDFKTGYMTLASPKSMFVSQVIGTAIGCIVSPCVFWLFYHAFGTLGQPGSAYPAPYALVYRNMAILGVDGFSALPKKCLVLCIIFFFAAIIINIVRYLVGEKYDKYIPVPMAMAIPFYIGSYFAIDMCVGSLILFIWQKLDRAKADAFGAAVASGLICGDGIWSLPSSFLALAGVQPPICMKFLSRAANAKVDGFLES